MPEQIARHQADLDQGRQDVENHELQQKRDAAGAAFDVARDAAGLPLEVELEREAVQVAEHPQRHPADRPLRDLGEHRVADLAEQGGGEAQRAIAEHQCQRQHQHHGLTRAGQCIDHSLQHDRHADVGDLGGDKQGDCGGDSAFEFAKVGQQAAHRIEVTRAGVRRGWGTE